MWPMQHGRVTCAQIKTHLLATFIESKTDIFFTV